MSFYPSSTDATQGSDKSTYLTVNDPSLQPENQNCGGPSSKSSAKDLTNPQHIGLSSHHTSTSTISTAQHGPVNKSLSSQFSTQHPGLDSKHVLDVGVRNGAAAQTYNSPIEKPDKNFSLNRFLSEDACVSFPLPTSAEERIWHHTAAMKAYLDVFDGIFYRD